MWTENSSSSTSSETNESRQKEDLRAYNNEDRSSLEPGQERLCLPPKACLGKDFMEMGSQALKSPSNGYFNNSWAKPRRNKIARSGVTRSLDRLYQFNWMGLDRPGLSFGTKIAQCPGLLGGGLCCARPIDSTSAQDFRPRNSPDEVMENLQTIEEGVHNGSYDLVFRGFDRIQNWQNTQQPSDAVFRLLRLLCDPASEGLPYLVREKILEKLPVLLFLVLRNPEFTLTKELHEETIKKILDLQINYEVLGGPEIGYYRDMCLMMMKKLPSPREWKGVGDTMGDLAIVCSALFTPTGIDMERIGVLYTLSLKVSQVLKNRREAPILNEYVKIHTLKLGVLNKVQLSLEQLIVIATTRDTDLFLRETCLLCIKQLMMSIREGDLHDRLENLLLELLEDKELQNMAIRVCLEVGPFGYTKALNWIDERKESLLWTSDVLKRRLLTDSEKIREDLEQSNINWEALRGISPTNYSNAVRTFRDGCEETEMIYVDIEVSESESPDAESFPVLSKVTEFLENSTLKVLVLLGNPGSGKSLICCRLGKYLLESYSHYLPLYGYLPAVEKRENDFANYCIENYNLSSASEEIEHRKVLFILDAYDEISEKINLIDSNMFFDRFPDCKVLITCRTHEVSSLENFVRHAEGTPKTDECKVLYIQPFSTEKIKEYIEKVNESPSQSSIEEKKSMEKESYQETWDKIESIPRLKAMLDTPLMLRICLFEQAFLQQIDQEDLTKFNIYEKFIQSYHENNIQKLLSSTGIATELGEYTEACVEYAFEVLSKGKIAQDTGRDERRSQIRSGCPLKGITFGKRDASELSFIHPSVHEYFVALRVRHILEALYGRDPELFTLEDLAQLNSVAIYDKKNVLGFMADFLTEEHRDTLLKIAKMRDLSFKTASDNSITILYHSGYSIEGMETREICIEEDDLSGATLTKADDSESYMKAAILAEACLDFTHLSDCDLQEVIIGERAPLKGHTRDITSVSFSGDGKYIASGSKDKTVRIWSVATSRNMLTFHGHASIVSSVSFSEDGKYVASGSWDRTIRIWDLATTETLHTLEGHSEEVTSVSFSEDMKYLASSSLDKTIRIWDLKTSTTICTLEGHSDYITSLSFSRDGKYIVSGSWDNTTRIWELATSTNTHIFEGHTQKVTSVSFSGDGRYVVSGSYDTTVRVWDLATSANISIFQGHSEKVNSVSFSEDGKYIASGSWDNTVRIWDLETSTAISTFQGHSRSVNTVCFSRDGRYIASGSLDHTVRICDLSASSNLHSQEDFSKMLTSVSLSGDSRYVASGSLDRTVRIWELGTSKNMHIFQGHFDEVTAVAFSRDGKYVASGSKDTIIRVWDLATASNIYTLECLCSSITSISFSGDGKYIASGSYDKLVRVWELETSEMIQTVQGHSDIITCVSFSVEGRYVASGSYDKTIRVWDLEASSNLHDLQHPSIVNSISYSDDGRHVASGCQDNMVRVWDLKNSTCVYILQGHSDVVSSVSFSGDGRYVASGSFDNTARIWDLATSSSVYILHGHSNSVTSVCFSVDGRYVVSSSFDGTVRVWNLQQPQFLSELSNDQSEKQTTHTNSTSTSNGVKVSDF